ncbi:hypothetical protein [Cobetia sp. AM6]|uniref:hypothetical protein n=1 Tax=Cobetia sp. AM6 TaxID=2661553 RepID=UPI0012994F2D|nr:hypothetical protein [Cobetia sp. AM6]BBO56027.1 hypothetical protein CLAM6_13380 [Cobetia sp. AM6]
MQSLKSLFAIAALSVAATGVASANDSEADARVRATLSDRVIMGQAQPVTQQAALHHDDAVETGMSVAASRVQKSISNAGIQGTTRALASDSADYVNDAGKSVSATRVEHALSESA